MDSSELIIFDNVINPMNQSTPGIRSGVEPDTIVTSRWFKPDIEDGEFYTIPEGCELSFDNTEWIPEGTYVWSTDIPGIPALNLKFLALTENGMVDSIGLSIISGTWPNCVVQAIVDGPLENFGPFVDSALVAFATLPQDINDQFFWGDKGYAFYSTEQHISVVKRILSFLNSDAFVDYIYVGSDQLFVGGSPVAAAFGAPI